MNAFALGLNGDALPLYYLLRIQTPTSVNYLTPPQFQTIFHFPPRTLLAASARASAIVVGPQFAAAHQFAWVVHGREFVRAAVKTGRAASSASSGSASLAAPVTVGRGFAAPHQFSGMIHGRQIIVREMSK